MNLRPGFLTRLSNLIVIQVIFVLSALALIIFYSQKEESSDKALFSNSGRISCFADQLISLLPSDSVGADKDDAFKVSRRDLETLFRSDESVQRVELYALSDDGEIVRKAEYSRAQSVDGSQLTADETSPPVSSETIAYMIRQNDTTLRPAFIGAEYSTMYMLKKGSGGLPLLLVTTAEHNYLISDRSHLGYAIFLLFLVSSLISLLTVYMITSRLKEPLKKLTYGLEKTAQGEMYHIVEPRGDKVIRELASSFNKMSTRLWVDNKRLKVSNQRFEESNRLLTDSQNFLSTLIDNSPDCVISTGVDGLIKVFNQQASDLFGLTNRDMIGRHISELFTQSLPAEPSRDEVEKNLTGVELLGKKQDGCLFPVYLVSSAIRSGSFGIIGYLYIVRDISESRSFQEMMVRIDRYCTRGEMAGDIAHEITNYLSVLSGNLELLPGLFERHDSGSLDNKLQVMSSTLDKIARFADGLMDLNHGEAHFELTDLNQLVENVVAFVKPQKRFDGIEFQTELSTELPPIRVDAGQIQQLLVNLVYNSSEAMSSQNGTKQISIRTATGSRDWIKTVRLDVIDNGPGVPQEALPTLFKTRFSTKRKGHGIGLVTCQRIVEAHDGGITYDYDQGAIFSVEIPVRDKHKYDSDESMTNDSLADRISDFS